MKQILFYSLLAIMAVGCNSIEEPSPEKNPVKESFSKFITPDEAGDEAVAFMNGLDAGQNETRSYGSISVGDVRLYNPQPESRANDNDTTFYVVNFNGGGYALVAADRSLDNKIYIYSASGSFDPIKNDIANIYIDNAIATMDEAPRNDSVGNSKPYRAPVEQNPYLPAIDEGYFNGELCIGYVYSSHNVKNPLLTTKWHQESPYNFYCYNSSGELAPVGCIAVAVGQICAYHRYIGELSSSYNWDYILAKSSHSETPDAESLEIARLLKYIGSKVNMIYGSINKGTSSVASTDDALNGFHDMGYESAKLADYSVDKIVQSLNENNPVFMRGDKASEPVGHSWAVDGYDNYNSWTEYYNKETGEFYGSTGGTSYIYLHFQGDNTWENEGWYLCSGINPTSNSYKSFSTFKYNINNKIITDIKR